MKNNIYILVFALCLIIGCNSSKSTVSNPEKALTVKNDTIKISKKPVRITNDTIRIANDLLEYEVIIIDPGFSSWLSSMAQPRNFHSLVYLETKNRIYVNEWNNRVLQPLRFNPNLYEMSINYEPFIHYGYEVNYLIYNYMIYFQNTYKQKLNGYVPMR
ncbi:MAG: hypothetical protein KA133_06315 [Flavobacterium sp.]|nr:hypothetical protein [Flavobacterium sp.]